MTDIYGSTETVDSLHSILSARLGLCFEQRHSSYRGGDYYIASPNDDTQYVIQPNHNSEQNEGFYEEYEHATTLVFAIGNSSHLESLLVTFQDLPVIPLARRDLSSDGKVTTSDWNGASFA